MILTSPPWTSTSSPIQQAPELKQSKRLGIYDNHLWELGEMRIERKRGQVIVRSAERSDNSARIDLTRSPLPGNLRYFHA